jgi:hypothetical protein
MSPKVNQNGDDRRDGNLSSPYRHRYRHHSKSSGDNVFRMTVTIGDDAPQAYTETIRKEVFQCVYAKDWTLSSPIVTERRLDAEKKAFSAVTIAVTMRKTGFYRHPHRHRHVVCGGQGTVTPDDGPRRDETEPSQNSGSWFRHGPSRHGTAQLRKFTSGDVPDRDETPHTIFSHLGKNHIHEFRHAGHCQRGRQ